MALTEAQLVVNHFCMAHNVKLDKAKYGQQLSIAKKLIDSCAKSLDEIIMDNK